MEQLRKFGGVWREEVEAIVGKLHRHDIVWGNVNGHNVFIDGENSDALVVDFDSLFN